MDEGNNASNWGVQKGPTTGGALVERVMARALQGVPDWGRAAKSNGAVSNRESEESGERESRARRE